MQQKSTGQILLRNSGVIFFIRFFPTLANLLVILYFSKRLSLEIYGAYQHIWAQYYVLAALALMGLPAYALTVGAAALVRLVQQWPVQRRLLLLAWPFLWALVFAGLQLQAGSLSFGLSLLFLWSAVAGMAQEGILLAGRRFTFLLTANFLYTAAFLWLHYLFINEGHSLHWLFSNLLLLGIAKLLVLLIPFFKVIRAGGSQAAPAVQPGEEKLWLHLGLFELSQVVFRWADKFVVSLFLSAGALAIYFNGTLEIPFLPILLGAAGSALLLQMQQGEGDSIRDKAEMVRLSGVVLSSLVLPLFCFLLFFAAPLFRLALSERYLAALPVFWVMLLLLPLRAYNFVTLLQHLRSGRVINMGALLDISLALALCFPLYHFFGLPGIALAFVFSTYVQVAFYLYYIKQLTGLGLMAILPLLNWLLKLSVLLLLFAGARLFAAGYDNPVSVLLPGLCLLLLSTGILLWADYRQLKRKSLRRV